MSDPNKSIMVDDWADEKYRQRYLFHVREIYDHAKAYREITFQNHVGYAKWLLASLLAVHGGTIYVINSLRSALRPEQIEGLIDGASWNLIGIAFTLLSGFFTWTNFQAANLLYAEWADPAMFYRTDRTPAEKQKGKKTDLINATLFLGVSFGLISAICFVESAITLIQTLRA